MGNTNVHKEDDRRQYRRGNAETMRNKKVPMGDRRQYKREKAYVIGKQEGTEGRGSATVHKRKGRCLNKQEGTDGVGIGDRT